MWNLKEFSRLKWGETIRPFKFLENFQSSLFSFFFNLYESPIFEFVFLQLSFNSHVISIIYVIIDTLFLNIGNFICEQLKVVQADFVKLNSKTSEVEFIGNVPKVDIKHLVDKHIEILDFCANFNSIFSPIIAFKFFAIGICICVVGFQVMMVISTLKLRYDI